MGCLAAIAGQVVDAISNPAWRFAEVGFMFWLIMGLGMAAARVPRRSPMEEVVPATASRLGGLARLGWQGAAVLLTICAMGGASAQFPGATPFAEYPGPVELRLEPTSATVTPGQCVEVRLLARANRGAFVDVTDTPDTQFYQQPSQNRLCLVNNTTVDPVLPPAQNIFCVPLKACVLPWCAGSRQMTVVATYLSRADSEVRSTVNIVCP
jgi:hypothetical protein